MEFTFVLIAAAACQSFLPDVAVLPEAQPQQVWRSVLLDPVGLHAETVYELKYGLRIGSALGPLGLLAVTLFALFVSWLSLSLTVRQVGAMM